MAKRHLTLFCVFAITAAAVVLPAQAEPITDTYHLTVCGSASGCQVQTPNVTPSAADFANLDPAIQSFYSSIPHPNAQHIGFTVTGANSAGYIYGHVLDTNDLIDTQFIYKNGSVGCCTKDQPFTITGINDGGLIIGGDDMGSFATLGYDTHSPDIHRPSFALDAASQSLLDAIYGPNLAWPAFFFDPGNRFLEVDDANDISGMSAKLGAFLLSPVSTVPEPSSLAVLLAGLGLMAIGGNFFRKHSAVECPTTTEALPGF